MGHEGLTNRAEHTDRVAGLACRERLQPRADDLVEQVDPTGVGVGAHDGKRAPHRDGRVAGEMRKATGLGAGGALRRLHAQDKLVAVVGGLLENPRVFEVDGASISHATPQHRPTPPF